MLLQYATLANALIDGIGLTVIVNVTGVPEQFVPPLAKTGVTVIVATTGALPVLVAVKDAMFPEPEAARPIDGALFVQLNTVPGTLPVKVTAAVVLPLQSTWLATAATFGVGFTVIVNVEAVPEQPLAVGVTVMVAVTGAVPLLTAVKEGILPFPAAARPMDGVLFVHAYVVPATGPLKLTAAVALLLQTTWLAKALTEGVGFTVMVNVIGAPVQTAPTDGRVSGVTVMVATTGALPLLMAVKDAMLPVPEAAKPMPGVLLVHL